MTTTLPIIIIVTYTIPKTVLKVNSKETSSKCRIDTGWCKRWEENTEDLIQMVVVRVEGRKLWNSRVVQWNPYRGVGIQLW